MVYFLDKMIPTLRQKEFSSSYSIAQKLS